MKVNKKKEQELLKKKMIDNYMKMQQDLMSEQEDHTSIQDVVGPDINIDDLNLIDDLNIDEPVVTIDEPVVTIEDVKVSNLIEIESVI